MDKLLRMKWIAAVYGEQFEWTTRVFRFLLQQGILGTIFIGIYFGIEKRPVYVMLSFAAFCVAIFLFYLTYKMADLKNVYFVTMFLTNVVLYPYAYIANGGASGLVPVWMVLFMVLMFIFLDGWRLYFVLFCTLTADSAVFLMDLLMPEWIKELQIGADNQVLVVGVSVLFIGTVLGIVIKYQIDKLAGERHLAEERGKEIKEISDSKSLFFANMSHEIRTPINTIIGLNEMILREDVSDEVAENAINIQNASKILLALINDILDMSKMESGRMEIVPAQYETAALFSDLVNIIWVRANQKKLDFKIDIADDIPSMLFGDEVRIKQILTNILTNAVKYTEQGSVTLTVTGESTEENVVRLKITVEDTGIGIRKENIEDLFTVFKRVDQEKTKKIEGTGLGLALSRQLVEMMGGTIKVDSIYQKGSTFTVTLDQQIIDPSPIRSIRYVSKHSAADREKYDRSFEAPEARILVVDDNEMNLLVAKKLLRDTKVQVDLASSGMECLEKTKENNYHVILMDHKMPEMDGEETLNILRSRQEGYCQKTPVIALTANVMSNASQWYQDRGFNGYLAKPISGALLEAALLQFLPETMIEYGAVGIGELQSPEYSSMVFHKKRKKKIAICAECVCDLPQEWVEKYDIKLMYYYVTTEEGRFIDTREIGSTELMQYLVKGKSAISEVASLEEYEAFFADRLMEAEQVILLTVASGLDKGYRNALQAAKNFDNVTVYDSGHLSSGMGLMVLQAAKMAEEGMTADEIIEGLTQMKGKVSTSFILQSVENMYQNHRIDKGVYKFSKALQLHPVLRMSQNQLILSGIELGREDQVIKSYIRRQFRRKNKIDHRLLFVTYVGLSVKQLEEIRKEILKHMQFEVIKFQKASATISSNCGSGTFGLLYIRK